MSRIDVHQHFWPEAFVEGLARRDRSPFVRRDRDGWCVRASDPHRVLHAGREPAVTLHAYSPPLWRMGAYEVRGDGTLARHSLSYAEELRPLEAA